MDLRDDKSVGLTPPEAPSSLDFITPFIPDLFAAPLCFVVGFFLSAYPLNLSVYYDCFPLFSESFQSCLFTVLKSQTMVHLLMTCNL